jgi:hypothetical protein
VGIAQLESGRAEMGCHTEHNNGIALRRLATIRTMEGEKR